MAANRALALYEKIVERLDSDHASTNPILRSMTRGVAGSICAKLAVLQ
jgi:hypothetical protein